MPELATLTTCRACSKKFAVATAIPAPGMPANYARLMKHLDTLTKHYMEAHQDEAKSILFGEAQEFVSLRVMQCFMFQDPTLVHQMEFLRFRANRNTRPRHMTDQNIARHAAKLGAEIAAEVGKAINAPGFTYAVLLENALPADGTEEAGPTGKQIALIISRTLEAEFKNLRAMYEETGQYEIFKPESMDRPLITQ